MPESTTHSQLFSIRLRAARDLREMNQEQLAYRAKLQASAVSQFETGVRKPSFDNLRRLADALNITTDYLLGRVDDPAGLAGAEQLYRDLSQLTGSDRRTAEDMIEILAQLARQRKQKKSSDDP